MNIKMDSDIILMEELKKQIEKGRSNFKKSPKDRITESYVITRLEALEKIADRLYTKHEAIICKYKKEELVNTNYVKNDIYNEGHETYIAYKSELKMALNDLGRLCLPAPSTSKGNSDTPVKLPNISIPVFSGNYVEWSSFKDLFISLVHNNSALDDVQRLHYLKTQLKGEAEQLIKHTPITHANYKKCWDLLQNRYSNKRFMSNCILKRLFSQRVMTYESSSGLKDLLDTTSDCLHELSHLGIEVDSWDVIIIYIVSQKLDTESRKQWELHVNNITDELPTFLHFKDFLERRFRALEFIEPFKIKPKSFQNTYQPKSLHITSDVICPHCGENHKLFSCSKFAKEEVNVRQDIVKSLGLCFNCLGSNHTGKMCRVPVTCHICKRRHHTLLHSKTSPFTVAVATESPEIEQANELDTEPSCSTNETTQDIVTNFVTGHTHSQTLLATALIKVEGETGYPQILRALLDQGSQASFISEAAAQLLRLRKTSAKSCISGLGGGQSDLTSKYVVMVNIQSLHDPTFEIQVKAHVLNKVTSVLPARRFHIPHWAELDTIILADPQYNSPNKIDILLGAEVYCNILKEGLIKHPINATIAQDTYLGWVLSGQVGGCDDNEIGCHNVILNMHVKLEDNELLKRFWELEAEPSLVRGKILTPEEQECENHYYATTSRDETGRYIVELPFRSNAGTLCESEKSRRLAVGRLLSLEKRLDRNPEQKQTYANVLKEYVTLGHMEEIKKDLDNTGKKIWLSHHAVIRPDKSTTQTRVVFNASDRSVNGVSLNDTLMVGPTLQSELRHIILRWRLHPICLTADIVKMYRQVKVTEKHTDYQRIVWRDDINAEIKDYRLLRLTFGMSCAPYLAVKTLQQVAVDEGDKFPLAASRVKTDFYMDDLMTGCQTETEAINVYEQMNSLLEKGGFKLQKWASNRKGLSNAVKNSLEDSSERKKVEIKEDDIAKILGVTWNRGTDEFNYTVKLSESSAPETKRQIIAEICRLYDPLGWLAPCIIMAKVFIQKLWLTGCGWDDKLPHELLCEWKGYREELRKLVNFHLPRWVQKCDNDLLVELHGFSDASGVAYSAAVYIRCITLTGKIKSHLVTAKTKVAPIKQVSIPRLELCAAVLVTKLLCEVAVILNVDKTNVHAWTDSTTVLAWLSDHPSRWKTFVANRTSEILMHLDSSQWSYVNTKDNPADCASRGIAPANLIENELWMNGPSWLRIDKIEYIKPISICTKTDLEIRAVKSHAATLMDFDELVPWVKFSTLRKLVRVIAFCRRFLQFKNTSMPREKLTPYLKVMEIQDALICYIRLHQSQHFNKEITNLLKYQAISKKSNLTVLNPFLDNCGILRVGGRIERSNIPEHSKHPIIVAGNSHLAKLIVDDAHQKTMHGGQQLTCNYIRTKYWIIRLKYLVRNHIHLCVPCMRYAASFRSQLMGQLPTCRVTPNKPFLNTGVDYAGPINIRASKGRGYKSYKGYICLFICMSTRAVHIEAVSDLTTEGFLAAFKRFVARRGRCNHLWSDNGTNFVGASRELKQLFSSERSRLPNELASALANNGTEWHFIPPHAPNFGGLWEAGIKSTKHHLRRVIGNSTLTYEELVTVLVQIEACLNSRPLSVASSDPNDSEPLTPGHFLVGEPLLTAPDRNLEDRQIGSLRRWQLTQRMLQNFWKRWSEEYLTHFFQRYKWRNKVPELNMGDVVLVREDNLPPARWVYGRVVKLHPGKDKVIRVVTLQYKGSLIQRPTSKLCRLPITDDDD